MQEIVQSHYICCKYYEC